MPTEEGTIAFLLEHTHSNWTTNSSEYNFPTFSAEGVKVNASKQGDGILSVKFSHSNAGVFEFRHPAPTDNPRGVHVAVTWTPQEVILYLNGQVAETVPVH